MFYSEFVLAKKGALGKVWLAAHWEKKLTRTQMSRSNIVEACASIIKPAAPLSLRTSGHLLIGVVRIHDGKQKALMHDCSDALVKIKLAFRPGTVDQPAGKSMANAAAITMQETFEEDDFDQFDLGPGFDDANVTANMGTAEEITLPEDNLSAIESVAPDMDGFGEDFADGKGIEPMPFLDETAEVQDIEVGREADVDQSFQLQDDFNESNILDEKDMDANANDITMGNDDIAEIPMDDISGIGDGPDFSTGFGDESGFGDVSMVPSEAADNSVANISGIDDLSASSASAAAAEAAGETSRPPTRFGEEIEALEAPAQDTSTAAASRPIKRKRKILIDSSLEIPSAEMRKGLELHGPDDITRQPYHKKRGPYSYDRPAFSEKMHAWRLQDTSAEAMLTRPSITGLAPELLKMFTKNYVTKPRAAFAPTSGADASREDDIELGRDPDQQLDDFMPADMDLPEIDNGPLDQDLSMIEPEQIPQDESNFMGGDDSRFGGDASGLDQTLDSATANASAVASSAFEFSGDGEDRLVTSEEYEEEHLTKRTQKMMTSLKAGFEEADEITYNGMTAGKNRRTAAACLFELLVLKTKGYIEVVQPEPYADITVTPTDALMAE